MVQGHKKLLFTLVLSLVLLNTVYAAQFLPLTLTQYKQSGTLFSGAQTITYSLYYGSTGGTAVSTDTQTTTFVNGTSVVELTNVSSLDYNQNIFVEIQVYGQSAMTPRVQIYTTNMSVTGDNRYIYVNSSNAIILNGTALNETIDGRAVNLTEIRNNLGNWTDVQSLYTQTGDGDRRWLRNDSTVIPTCIGSDKLTSLGNGVMVCANDVTSNGSVNGTTLLAENILAGSFNNGSYTFTQNLSIGGFSRFSNGINSISFGSGSNASASNSFAISSNAISTGVGAGALGADTQVLGSYSYGIGNSNLLNATNSFILGNGNEINGSQASALGMAHTINSYQGVAIGAANTIDGQSALALGYNLNPTALNAFLIGNGIDSSTLMTNDIPSSLVVGFNGMKAFFVNGTNVGINTVTPTAELDVNGSVNVSGNLTSGLITIWSSRGKVGINASVPAAPLDIGGYGNNPVVVESPMILLKQNTNHATGIEATNPNTGNTSDTRFAIVDTHDNYIAMLMPSSGNTESSIFGLSRKNATFIFSNKVGGENNRDFGVGTVNPRALILGTNNTARMTILRTGLIGIGTTTPTETLTITGRLGVNGNITNGSWQGQNITDSYISSASTWNNYPTIISSIGNWTNDQVNYATITYVGSIGNWSADSGSYLLSANALTLAQVNANVGNWSNDRSSLPNLTLSQINTNMGNWSADKTSYLLSSNALTLAQVNTNVGNWSADKGSYALLAALNAMNTTNNIKSLGFNITADYDSRYCFGNGSNCPAGQAYTAGAGLVLTGQQFNVSATTCIAGEYSWWNGTAFKCSADITGTGGDGNNYPTAIAITGTSTKTINVSRSGLADITGTFADIDTTYTNGSGVLLTGTQFNVSTSYLNSLYPTFAYVTTIGNWSNDKGSLPNLTYAQITTNIGNWSADKSSYLLIANQINLSSISTNIGNWSADKSSYSTLVALNTVGNWSADRSNYVNTTSGDLRYLQRNSSGFLNTTTQVYLANNATNVSIDSGTLFVDSANNRTGIGTLTPTTTLTVSGSINVTNTTTQSALYLPGGGYITGNGSCVLTYAPNGQLRGADCS